MRLLISGFNKSSFYEAAADVITAAAGIQQKSIAKAEAKFIQAIYILLLRLFIITIKASHKSLCKVKIDSRSFHILFIGLINTIQESNHVAYDRKKSEIVRELFCRYTSRAFCQQYPGVQQVYSC